MMVFLSACWASLRSSSIICSCDSSSDLCDLCLASGSSDVGGSTTLLLFLLIFGAFSWAGDCVDVTERAISAEIFLSFELLWTKRGSRLASTLSSSHTSRTSDRLEARNCCLLSVLEEEARAEPGRLICGSFPRSWPVSLWSMEACADSLSPVAGLPESSSGRGRSLKELGGRATWLVEPE